MALLKATSPVVEDQQVATGATEALHTLHYAGENEVSVIVVSPDNHDFQVRAVAEAAEGVDGPVIEETPAGAAATKGFRVEPMSTRTRIEVVNNDAAGHNYSVYVTSWD